MSYVLGIDLGTSSLKGLLLTKNGQVVAQASSSYPLIHKQVGYSEQNPQDWLKSCLEVMNKIADQVPDFRTDLEGLAISGQMHGLILLDEAGQVLRPAILWNDTRNTSQCQRITEDLGEDLITITKNKALEGFTLPKILWIQEHESEIWKQVRQILLPKDYLGYCLTGQYFTDKSDAAGTLLFDVAKGSWSEEILSRYSISLNILPKALDSVNVVGKLTDEIAQELGLAQSVLVAAGGADNACGAVGAGILSEGVGMVSIGTSGVFLTYEDQANDYYKGQFHLFNHGQADAYYSMGVTLAAGHSLNWFKQTFAADHSFEDLLSGIEKIKPGSEGLFFAPYIVGERTPYADSQIRGSFIGIDTGHSLKHFARSVLEGITFSLKDSQEMMRQVAGKDFTRIISVGGGVKNPVWLQMQADIFNVSIQTLEAEQGPGLGAGMMAAVALGWYEDLVQAAQNFVAYQPAVEPIAGNVQAYQAIYQNYRKIYPATKDICKKL